MKLAAALCLTVLGAAAAKAECTPETLLIEGGFGTALFNVAIADDVQERARGLMFVEEMPLMAGMLFVYEKPQPVSFWMRNTLIPLDMLFAGSDGRILAIHENAIPLDETAIDGGEGVLAVIEINGGLASRLGIVPGDAIQHQAFGPQAALPCP